MSKIMMSFEMDYSSLRDYGLVVGLIFDSEDELYNELYNFLYFLHNSKEVFIYSDVAEDIEEAVKSGDVKKFVRERTSLGYYIYWIVHSFECNFAWADYYNESTLGEVIKTAAEEVGEDPKGYYVANITFSQIPRDFEPLFWSFKWFGRYKHAVSDHIEGGLVKSYLDKLFSKFKSSATYKDTSGGWGYHSTYVGDNYILYEEDPYLAYLFYRGIVVIFDTHIYKIEYPHRDYIKYVPLSSVLR